MLAVSGKGEQQRKINSSATFNKYTTDFAWFAFVACGVLCSRETGFALA